MSEEILNNDEIVAETPVETPAEAVVETEAAVEEVAPEAAAEVTPEAVLETIAETPAEAAAEVAVETPVETVAEAVAAAPANAPGRLTAKRRMPARAPRAPREKPEFDTKAIDVRRVTRVVSGGRRFSLHVSMIAGDRNGRVGLGTGKAMDTQVAMEKALKSAKKNMIKLPIDDKKSVAHETSAKFDTSEIWIAPNKGKGLIAGSSARVILSLAGLSNVTAKFHGGTKNKLNNARATMKALSKLAIKN
jgi:small subunit ribosomal protein S5